MLLKFIAGPTESWQIPMTLKRNDQSWSKEKKLRVLDSICHGILLPVQFACLQNHLVLLLLQFQQKLLFALELRLQSCKWIQFSRPYGRFKEACWKFCRFNCPPRKNPSMCCCVEKNYVPCDSQSISPSLPAFRSHIFSCHSPKRWFDVGHWPTDSSMSRFPSQDTPLGGWLGHSRGHANHNLIRNTCNAPCGLSVVSPLPKCKPSPIWSLKKLMLKLCNLTGILQCSCFIWFSVLALQQNYTLWLFPTRYMKNFHLNARSVKLGPQKHLYFIHQWLNWLETSQAKSVHLFSAQWTFGFGRQSSCNASEAENMLAWPQCSIH